VPALRRLNLVSVFNYLEMRFNPAIRMLASAACIVMNVGGRMSVVLFLAALAIATITGIDVVWSILIMGVCTIIYTALGGMRAVVWTDFVQVLVLMGGALFAIGFVIHSLGGAAIYDTAMAYDKTRLLNFSFDLTQPTVWGFIVLIFCDTVLTFPKDQVLMQRTLSTSSDKNAGRSVWVFAVVLLPGGSLFYLIGTVLFAYYKTHPERMDPLLPIDATFPLFIGTELPPGITGLIIVGIFAAAMGTLSGIINSVATLLSVDFYERLAKNPTQRQSVRFAEWMSVVIGLVGVGLALVLSLCDIHSLLDLTSELVGLLGGGFAGAYTLGMFTRRAHSAGVAIGIATAIVVTLLAWSLNLVHPYFYLGISILVCLLVGYVASLCLPAPQRSLEGLTVRIGSERGALTVEGKQ
jgi:solute:Na+ symporter, SSS family